MSLRFALEFMINTSRTVYLNEKTLELTKVPSDDSIALTVSKDEYERIFKESGQESNYTVEVTEG